MPTYTYRREDGTTFEVKQRITEDPLDECPETGQDVERIITGNTGLIFKGEGFHVNDYGGGPGAAEGGSADANGEAESDDGGEGDSSTA